MKNDNRGFTLIELIISILIFGIMLASVFGFMLAGARSYNTVTNQLNLDLQAQLAVNQISEYVIDCSAGLYFRNGKLYVLNEDPAPDTLGNTTYTAHVFQLTDGSIKYGTGAAAKSTTDGTFSCSVTAADLLVKNVTGFSVTQISSDGVNVTSVRISLNLANNSATYSGIKTIALRNKPAITVVS